MEKNSVLSNKGLDLTFVDLTYEVNAWTDVFKIGRYLVIWFVVQNLMWREGHSLCKTACRKEKYFEKREWHVQSRTVMCDYWMFWVWKIFSTECIIWLQVSWALSNKKQFLIYFLLLNISFWVIKLLFIFKLYLIVYFLFYFMEIILFIGIIRIKPSK